MAVSEGFRQEKRLNDQLLEALASRDVIGQAKGMLMVREGCTADEAFDILRRASQARNTKLRDVAAELVLWVGSDRRTAGPLPPPRPPKERVEGIRSGSSVIVRARPGAGTLRIG